jgi:hypothetical protein
MPKLDHASVVEQLEKMAAGMETRVGAAETAAARRAARKQLDDLRAKLDGLQMQLDEARKGYATQLRLALLDLKRDGDTLRRIYGRESAELRHFGLEPAAPRKRAKPAKKKAAPRRAAKKKSAKKKSRR